jgi:hypothetical protein
MRRDPVAPYGRTGALHERTRPRDPSADDRLVARMDSVRISPQVLLDPLPGTQTLVRVVARTQDRSTLPADFGFVHARLPTSTLGNIDAGHCTSQDAAAPSAVFTSA